MYMYNQVLYSKHGKCIEWLILLLLGRIILCYHIIIIMGFGLCIARISITCKTCIFWWVEEKLTIRGRRGAHATSTIDIAIMLLCGSF